MNLPVPSALAGVLFLAATLPFGGTARESTDTTGFEFPARLSKTGFFADLGKHDMAEGFEPYDVNVDAWADGASKRRFLRVPKGKKATFKAKGAWEFPEGSVFLQTLGLETGATKRRVETRVIVVGKQGLEFGTYLWREDQSDADFVEKGRQVGVSWDEGYLLWNVAPLTKCDECHNPKTQAVLGLTTAQLNKDVGARHQFDLFAEKGIVVGVPKDRKGLARLPDPFDEKLPLTQRARAYLDTNCASCHRPGGNGSGFMDLRYDTAVEETGLGHEREILIEGRPRSSWIYLRIIYEGRRKMPSELTIQTDEKGAELIYDWVESLARER